MKTTIIISDGVKQIMFTPENDSEKEALRMFKADDKIELAIKFGSFHTSYQPEGYKTAMCEGGYLRTWVDSNSIMFVLTPKEEK